MASQTGCPLELHNIDIDKCDEMFDKNCNGKTRMPFYRARYDSRTGQSPNSPREQVSMVLLRIVYRYEVERQRVNWCSSSIA